jgi:hypothetical protein
LSFFIPGGRVCMNSPEGSRAKANARYGRRSTWAGSSSLWPMEVSISIV